MQFDEIIQKLYFSKKKLSFALFHFPEKKNAYIQVTLQKSNPKTSMVLS